jgi:hypothetical protein
MCHIIHQVDGTVKSRDRGVHVKKDTVCGVNAMHVVEVCLWEADGRIICERECDGDSVRLIRQIKPVAFVE